MVTRFKQRRCGTGIPIPNDCVDLEHAPASYVEYLVKFALNLHWSYTGASSPVIHRVSISPLRITWVRILRSPYLVVASSNLEESRLSVWIAGNTLELRMECYVPGPVMNGQTYYAGDSVKLALTIGSKFELLASGCAKTKSSFIP